MLGPRDSKQTEPGSPGGCQTNWTLQTPPSGCTPSNECKEHLSPPLSLDPVLGLRRLVTIELKPLEFKSKLCCTFSQRNRLQGCRGVWDTVTSVWSLVDQCSLVHGSWASAGPGEEVTGPFTTISFQQNSGSHQSTHIWS
jgi:hypothetical protein